MITEHTYSFCDDMEQVKTPPNNIYNRIIIGSTFCDNYLIHTSPSLYMEAYSLAKSRGVKVTLVITITGQSLLQVMRDKLEWIFELYQDTLDEVVVNDFAMLTWIRKTHPAFSVWLGRLLIKDTRDPRYSMDQHICNILDHVQSGSLYGFAVSGVELDAFEPLTVKNLPDISLGIHYPYTYVSTGRICEIGSIGQDVIMKFCATVNCSRQCTHTWIYYDSNGIPFLKYGRAIYGNNHIEKVLTSLPPSIKIRVIEDGFAKKTLS